MKSRKEAEEEGDTGNEPDKDNRRETQRRTRGWGRKKEDKLSAADGILLCPPGLQSGCLATAVA